MFLFGEQLVAVRLFAAACLLVSAVAGYAASLRFASPLVAGLATAAGCVLAVEGVTFQRMRAEHLALALLMPAVRLLVAHRHRLWSAFAVGALVSLATIVRTNLAYVALVLAVFYLWRWVRPMPDVPRRAIAAYGLGGCLPLAPLLLAYWRAGALEVFAVSTVEVAAAYAYTQDSVGKVITRYLVLLLDLGRNSPWTAAAIVLFVGIGWTALLISRGRRVFRGDTGLVLLVLGAVAASILTGGVAYPHHLLQVIPLTVIVAAAGYEMLRRQRAGAATLVGLSVFLVGAGAARFAGENLEYLQRWPGRSDWREAAEVIGRNLCCGQLVYAPQGHVVHWYMGRRPPSYIVHPNAVHRPAIVETLARHGYVAADEWRRILERNIGYVVLDEGKVSSQPWYWSAEKRRHLAGVLNSRFYIWSEVGELTIYRARAPDGIGAPEAPERHVERPEGSEGASR